MLWSLASSAFIIYLYHKLSAESATETGSAPADGIQAELDALNARIAVIESKIGN